MGPEKKIPASLDDLRELRLNDRDIFHEYGARSSCPLNGWWTQFPYFLAYGLKGKRRSLWTVVDGLFVPFLYSGRFLSLLTIPFGEGSPETYLDVLRDCFSLCGRMNNDRQDMTHARWVSEDQLRFLEQAPDFSSRFRARNLAAGPEYHYSIESLLRLQGKDFAQVRRKRNLFHRRHPEVIIRTYEPSDLKGALALQEAWAEEARTRYSDIFDEVYYPAFLRNQEHFGLITLVAEQKGTIIGLVAGGPTPDGGSYCYFRKALTRYDGLSEVLLLQLAKAIHDLHPNIRLLNDGGTGRKPGMTAFKERFRPVRLADRYRLEMGALEIRHAQAFRGPSIAGLTPSGRLVVTAPRFDLFRNISPRTLARLEKLVSETLGADLGNISLGPAQTPAGLLGRLALLIQQASRHPVAVHGTRQLDGNTAELTFELLRPAMLDTVADGLQMFWRAGFLGFGDDLFNGWYRRNRAALGLTLAEYIVHDRVATARRLGIPARADRGFRVWLGRGAESRLTSLGYTQNTPRLAKTIAGDKSLSHSFLRRAGLPVVEQGVAASAQAAVRAARRIGFPVVLKPRHGNKGEGVCMDLLSEEAVGAAYEQAARVSRNVVVERQVEGDDFRLLVIDGRFIAAVRRVPARVTGDGRSSVLELMETVNRRERRDGLFLIPLTMDNEVKGLLAEQGLTADSVPEKGRIVFLRRAANVSLGGTIDDVTDMVHPDNRAAAVAAARTCLLDVAGVDFKSPDIGRSWGEGFGKIIEINSGPGIELHMAPTSGPAREITHHIVRCHFPPQRRRTFPTVLITGRYNKNAVARYCAEAWRRTGSPPALLYRDRLVTPTSSITLSGSQEEKTAVLDRLPECDCAAVILSPSALLAEGPCLDSVACAVLTDDFSSPGIQRQYHDPDVVRRGLRLPADLATEATVIDARSETLIDAFSHLPPDKVVLVWPELRRNAPTIITRHLAAGGRALCLLENDSGKPVLCWQENGSSASFACPPQLLQGKNLSFLLASAALLATTRDATRLRAVLPTLPRLGGTTPLDSLVLDKREEKILACAAPGDREAMKTLGNTLKPDSSLYLAASSRNAANTWKTGLDGEAQKIFILLEDGDPSEKHDEAICFADLDSAWEESLHLAGPGDTVLLLTDDPQARSRFLARQDARLQPGQHASSQKRWSAERLAECFRGTWVCGRDTGWGVDRIGWGVDMTGGDMVTILPGGYPDKSDGLLPMEAAVAEAIRNGARGVVTAVIPAGIPRYHQVMQCDDPLAGLLRLAQLARRELTGPLVFLAAGKKELPALVERMRNAFPHWACASPSGPHASQLLPEPALPPVAAAALTLVNLAPDAGPCFCSGEVHQPWSLKILRPDILVVDGRSLPPDDLARFLAAQPGQATALVRITPDQEDHLRHRHFYSPREKIRFFTTQGDSDHQESGDTLMDALSKLTTPGSSSTIQKN
ncbi:MAG: hypothetical protein Kow0089_18400 [Desulfobulbaceae bacterium]